MVICLERVADLHVSQPMPLPLTVSCFSKIQIGFTFLVPAHLGSPEQRAIKQGMLYIREITKYRGTENDNPKPLIHTNVSVVRHHGKHMLAWSMLWQCESLTIHAQDRLTDIRPMHLCFLLWKPPAQQSVKTVCNAWTTPTNHLFYSHYTGQPALASTSRSTLLVPRFTARMPVLVATSTLHLD